jgi:hypothetical protein
MYTFLMRNPDVCDLLGDLDMDGGQLNWIVKKQDGRVWSRFMWLRISTLTGLSLIP